MRAATRGRLGWVTLAVVVLLAAGGAAEAPGGWLLGTPPLAVTGALVLVALGLIIWAPERGEVGLGLLVLLVLVLLGVPLPGLRALTGGPLFGLALGAFLLALWGAEVPWGRWFLPIVGVAYVLGAAQVQRQVGPEGDEPHYLMVADSLLRDHDLSLEQDYADGRYRTFHPSPLAPHYRVRGKNGEIYSLHAVGLSLLILPAYALGGYKAASFFMAGLAVLLAVVIRRLVKDVLADDRAADMTALVVALSPPLWSYAGLVFTEIPAALGVAAVLHRGRRPAELKAWGALGLGAILAFLPWLNVRYAALSVLLALYVLAGRPGRMRGIALLGPLALSAIGLMAYHFALYGFLNPGRVYGRRPEFSLLTLPEGLPGLLLDQEFGLLVYAPVFALVLAGGYGLWRKDRRLAVTAFALCVTVVVTAATWPMWRGGWNPPARFLVPLVPALALAVGAALLRGLSPSAALLVGWGLWLGIAGATEPRLVHRDRDGTAPLFRAVSGAEEWTRLLPGFVLEDPDRRRLAVVWTVALAAAALWRGRPTARGLAGASVGLLVAAGVASWVSRTSTAGRDAVRLVGRPALAVPGLSFQAEATGRWSASVLPWGPLYEPHRFPAGAPLAERVALPAGRFRLVLRAAVLDDQAEPPRLRLRGPTCAGLAAASFHRVAEGWAVDFDLPMAERDLTPMVEGGGAFLLSNLELRVQP